MAGGPPSSLHCGGVSATTPAIADTAREGCAPVSAALIRGVAGAAAGDLCDGSPQSYHRIGGRVGGIERGVGVRCERG